MKNFYIERYLHLDGILGVVITNYNGNDKIFSTRKDEQKNAPDIKVMVPTQKI